MVVTNMGMVTLLVDRAHPALGEVCAISNSEAFYVVVYGCQSSSYVENARMISRSRVMSFSKELPEFVRNTIQSSSFAAGF
jgi:hypothetical protein